ncbi:DNA polymerase [Candidatus Woesearchaeota archaeon]|nr:DNA polymerase [Candidatus Woesearchaeota archaeon]
MFFTTVMAEKLDFYPMEISYKVIDGRPSVFLYGTADSRRICVLDDSFVPYFIIIPVEKADIEDLRQKLGRIEIEGKEEDYKVVRVEDEKLRYVGKEVHALKVLVNIPGAVPEVRNVVKQWDAVESTNEYDIPYVRRYLVNKQITPMMLHKVEAEPMTFRAKVPCYRLQKIEQSGESSLQKPRILAFDIETYNPLGKEIDPQKNPILMISFFGEGFEKVFTYKKFGTDNKAIEFVDDERRLILAFKEVVEKFSPDIITGYFSDGFDFPYLKERAKKFRIKLDLGTDHSELKVTRRGSTSKASIRGLTHLDVFKSIRKMLGRAMDTDSYSLNNVAQELLGEEKHAVELEGLADVWDNKPDHLEQYCEYNLQDSVLAYRLCEKILPNLIEMVKLVSLPLSEINRMGSSQLVEAYLLREAKNAGQIAPNKPSYEEIKERKGHTYAGGFVFEPKPGLYDDIVVFDFRSLYPTIITSHNIDPGTLNCSCCRGAAEKSPAEEGYWFCKKRKGFIPTIIEEIITRRMRIKEMMKQGKKGELLDARQASLKLLANSFYGYLGFFAARWYSLECAKSTTAYGRYYIHKVIDSAGQKGFDVLYSDTDSVFLSLGGKAKKEADAFADSINAELPGIMELEYEGYYPRGIFVSAKMGEYGAKKKYALLSEDKTIKIKGFETVRRNWSFIAKKVQEEVLQKILAEGSPESALEYVKETVAQLRKNKVPLDKVVIHTQLQKPIEEYDAVGPHVAAAQRMKNKDIPVGPGSIIKFVIIKGTDKIRDRARLVEETEQKDYDSEYYINNQVVPAVSRIFSVLGVEQDQLLDEGKQSKLGKFF